MNDAPITPGPIGSAVEHARHALAAVDADDPATALPRLREAQELITAAIDEAMAAAVVDGETLRSAGALAGLSENAVGRLRLKIVVPITEWKPRYVSFPWFVYLTPTSTNGLTKDSGADAFQVKSLSESRFLDRLGELTPSEMDDIANAIAICVGAP